MRTNSIYAIKRQFLQPTAQPTIFNVLGTGTMGNCNLIICHQFICGHNILVFTWQLHCMSVFAHTYLRLKYDYVIASKHNLNFFISFSLIHFAMSLFYLTIPFVQVTLICVANAFFVRCCDRFGNIYSQISFILIILLAILQRNCHSLIKKVVTYNIHRKKIFQRKIIVL